MSIDDPNDIIQRRTVDHPGTRPCPHCGQLIDMPKTIPYVMIEGDARGPASVIRKCPHCGKDAEFPLYL